MTEILLELDLLDRVERFIKNGITRFFLFVFNYQVWRTEANLDKKRIRNEGLLNIAYHILIGLA